MQVSEGPGIKTILAKKVSEIPIKTNKPSVVFMTVIPPIQEA
jgi:hypothetical protein